MSQEVVPTNPTIASVINRIQREIQHLRNSAHILTPMARTQIDSVAMGKIPVLRVASISPNPADHEVYEMPELPGKKILTKVGLQRLEALAGISNWRTSTSFIDGNPLKARGIASATIEDIDGTIRECTQTFEYDLTDGSPQMKKMENKPKQLAQARANIVTLAETKAMNRVRRTLLGLQSTFTEAELRKPFVIMKLVDAPLDASDPLIKKLLIMKQLKISSEMYEAAAHSLPSPGEVIILPPAPETILLPGPDIPEDTARLALEHGSLVDEVTDLYRRKVRGGRGSNKAPLPSLTIEELTQLKALLVDRPDIKE